MFVSSSMALLSIDAIVTSGPPAFAAGTWSIQSTPPAQVQVDDLAAVSCAGSTFCAASGSYWNAGKQPLVEVWNGSSWSSSAISGGGVLNGVSCTSKTFCMAVGGSGFGTTLGEEWNGTTWVNSGTVTQYNGSALVGVSCQRTSCTAVGNGPNLWFVEGWNGSTWTAGALVFTSVERLTNVSCAGADCVAVGYSDIGSVPSAMVAMRSGKRWSTETPPVPAAATSSELSGVSCSSATTCSVVGWYTDSTGARFALADSWNGSAWTLESTPSLSSPSAFTGVSCSSATACQAVGYSTAASGATKGMSEAWNGTSWATTPIPSPAGAANTMLNSLSCHLSAPCIAVGHDVVGAGGGQQALAERWNGKRWTIQAASGVTGTNAAGLNATACIAANSCEAVGQLADSALALSWDGTFWNMQDAITPPGTTSSVLNGVSCPAAGSCVAVGQDTTNAGGHVALAESWDGTAWSVLSVPMPTGALSSDLLAVSCAAPLTCEAVGSYYSSTNVQTSLAEAWNGATWTLQTGAAESNAVYTSPQSVSCPTTGMCVAVGSYGYSCSGITCDAPFGEKWDGTNWSVLTPSNVIYHSGFQAVSCSSGTSCMSVGTYNKNGYNYMLAETWNGASWTIVNPPLVTGFDYLYSVACTSASACTAGGNASLNAQIETWDGTSWTTVSTPAPSGASQSSLSGASCPTASECEIVGSAVVNGQSQSLAESNA